MRQGGLATRLPLDDDLLGDPATLAKVYIWLGGGYPLWRLLAPQGAVDPFWLWLIVGAAYVSFGVAALRTQSSPTTPWIHLPTFAVGAHLNVLFALNPGEPFYAVAGVMAVFAAVLVIPNGEVQIAYALMVAVLASLQILGGASNAPLFAIGVIWVVALAIRLSRHRERARVRAVSELEVAHSALAHERAERQRLQQELEVSQRMDSLGRLAGAFSHEFNNQLMAIRIHADLLDRSLPATAPQRSDVEQIRRTTGSAADLTARLLAFSRPSRTREESADLRSVVRHNLVTLRHVMSEKTPVTSSDDGSACHAPVDAKQLSQVLLNLALNARDAMPEGGTLRISVSRAPRRAVELPVDIRAESLAVLTVIDTGCGMSPEVRDRLFEPFFTTRADRGNSGLGLSVVYGIVKETGGHIRVTSEPNQGARFDIYWPEIPGSRVQLALAEEVRPPEPCRARVLLVEDQPELRDGLTRCLGDHGFAVVSCESGEEALARASDVDVIASDVVLRGMDGIELLGRLRRIVPQLPAVLFSGHLDHLATQRRNIPEGVRFLEKPFHPEALVTTLDVLLATGRAVAH